MTTKFVNFSKYPWAAQCLEMSKTTGRLWPYFRSDMFRTFIKDGDYGEALQNSFSVGSWADSVQGYDYWEAIHEATFEV